jgi:hypothetical protein
VISLAWLIGRAARKATAGSAAWMLSYAGSRRPVMHRAPACGVSS